MSFKVPNIPSERSSISVLADFLELMCIANDGNYSLISATKQIAIGTDEMLNEGVESEEDVILDKLQEALGEVDKRKNKCNGHYPFATTSNSICIDPDCDEYYEWNYLFLLFATRNNMTTSKVKNGIDGTLLFEEISSAVAKEYWGDRANSFVFGTSTAGGFRAKIDDLISKINEGGRCKEPEGATHSEQDGKLDFVVWKPFSDERRSQLIGFGQSKTGTNWKDYVTQLLPDHFCATYLSDTPFLSPVRLFFTTDVCAHDYEQYARRAGLFFDRCRLMDYLPQELPGDLYDRLYIWTSQSIEDFRAQI